MDMWKPFRLSTARHAPQASILFDKFHILRHLGDALDQVRKSEYARVSGRQRRFIKGQKEPTTHYPPRGLSAQRYDHPSTSPV